MKQAYKLIVNLVLSLGVCYRNYVLTSMALTFFPFLFLVRVTLSERCLQDAYSCHFTLKQQKGKPTLV